MVRAIANAARGTADPLTRAEAETIATDPYVYGYQAARPGASVPSNWYVAGAWSPPTASHESGISVCVSSGEVVSSRRGARTRAIRSRSRRSTPDDGAGGGSDRARRMTSL
jgi:hypothetical protein